MTLTKGALQKILAAADTSEMPVNPIVQVLGIKKMDSKRFRAVISDGDHYFTGTILGSQLNDMVTDGTIQTLVVIRLKQYTCNVLQNTTRKIIFLLNVDVIRDVSQVDGKIGDPSQIPGDSSVQVTPTRSTNTQISDNDTPTQQYTTPSTHNNGSREVARPSPNTPSANDYGACAKPSPSSRRLFDNNVSNNNGNNNNSSNNSDTNHSNMNHNNMGINNHNSNNHNHNNMNHNSSNTISSNINTASSSSHISTTPTTPTGGRVDDSLTRSPSVRNLFPISSLNPYSKRTIRARVTAKSPIRTWNKPNSQGKLFSMDLLDHSGEIKATGFNGVVDRYHDTIEQGKIYYITKGKIKTANKRFTSLRNDYEMELNDDCSIELCTEECNLPDVQYVFVPIRSIEQVNKDDVVDVIGVVMDGGEVSQITTKATHKQVSKRDITLVDKSNASIRATLWGTEAENFHVHATREPVVVIKGAKVSDFGGRSLSIGSSSNFLINPDMPECRELRGWWENGGSEEKSASLSAGSGAVDYKTISQIKDDNLGMGDQADYFNVRATSVFYKKTSCLYKACPGQDCNKKVQEEGDGQYRCEKCDKTFPNFNHRLILQTNVADHTGSQWITSFQDSAETILGVSADELGRLQADDDLEFERIFQDAAFKPFTLKLRAQTQVFQDEAKVKCITVTAAPIDYIRECRRMLKGIRDMENNEN